jgi:hypothetical protein
MNFQFDLRAAEALLKEDDKNKVRGRWIDEVNYSMRKYVHSLGRIANVVYHLRVVPMFVPRVNSWTRRSHKV